MTTASTRNFNPRSPHGERRGHPEMDQSRRRISIHAPRTGSDTSSPALCCPRSHFNPRSPHGERPLFFCRCGCPLTFQSTLPARGATGDDLLRVLLDQFQSTLPARGATSQDTSSHAPPLFQSTLPARGATASGQFLANMAVFQSTLPARGATGLHGNAHAGGNISIHAPRTGSDHRGGQPHGANAPFQSTLPARGATIPARRVSRGSTHFNPRSPHGERRTCLQHPLNRLQYFNPRSPHGERLRHHSGLHPQSSISIHAPRTGSDGSKSSRAMRPENFNPRSPHGERQIIHNCTFETIKISIHAPRTGSDVS